MGGFFRNPIAAIVPGLVCAGVAIHEWDYHNHHRYHYGPALIIAILALAAAAIGFAVAAVAWELEQHTARIDALWRELRRDDEGTTQKPPPSALGEG